MPYTSAKIKDVILDIKRNRYVLPAIQREMVWSCEQIEKLFDSILSGYPINSMLFWQYEVHPSQDDYKFYKFIDCYDEYNTSKNHNEEYSVVGDTNVTAVLDGQQRLTSLVIGLLGYMNIRKKGCRSNKAQNYDKKYLYINLLHSKSANDENDSKYEFKFNTVQTVEEDHKAQKALWFKMGDLLKYNNVSEYRETLPRWFNTLEQSQINRIEDIFHDLILYFITGSEVLNYYLEKTDSLDRALQIFVRINSGGTQLDYTDFLMSMVVSKWSDAREKINDAMDNILKDYNFNVQKDIFLRACLFLTGTSLNLKADNFKSESITKIKTDFSDIVKYLRASCNIFKQLGYSKDNLRSNLIILPIARFLQKQKKEILSSDDLSKVKEYIQRAILGRVFSSGTSYYLQEIRKVIDSNSSSGFPLSNIKATSIKTGKVWDFNEETLLELIDNARYGTQSAWAILSLLYPSKNFAMTVFDEDHIYPKAKLNKAQMNKGGDYIANLQLLPSDVNQQKSDTIPNEWLPQYCVDNNLSLKQYKTENYLPDIELTMNNFGDFIAKRKEIILEVLKSKIGVSKQKQENENG